MIAKSEQKGIRLFYIFFGVLVGVFVGITIVANYYLTQESKFENTLYPNITIDNRNVGGMTKTEALTLLTKHINLPDTQVTILYKNDPIATFSAEQINLHSTAQEVIDRAYLVGRSTHTTSRIYQKIATIFGLQKYSFSTTLAYDHGTVMETLSTLEDQYNKPAKNALFSFENGKVATFREAENGVKLQTDDVIKTLDTAISRLSSGSKSISIILAEQILKPEIALAQTNNFGIEELIGVGTSNFTHSAPERVYNVTLATSKFNGVLIPKGAVISFNDLVGDISSLTGYKQAYVIKNGRTVLGDGGGVCQVSTTLFRAALNTGLPILERTSHAYRVQYYENDAKPGLDATVFGPTVDLKIQNDTPAAILIETEIDKENNILTFKLFGKKDGRTAELSPIRVYDEQPPPAPRYEDDPTLKKGVTKQVDFASWGAKSQYTYKIHKADKSTYERTFNSVYRPWQAVYLVGQAD